MGEQNLHRFKAESGTGELMRGSFCEGEKRAGQQMSRACDNLVRWRMLLTGHFPFAE